MEPVHAKPSPGVISHKRADAAGCGSALVVSWASLHAVRWLGPRRRKCGDSVLFTVGEN